MKLRKVLGLELILVFAVRTVINRVLGCHYFSAQPAVTFLVTVHHHHLAMPGYTMWCEKHMSEQLAHSCYITVQWPGIVGREYDAVIITSPSCCMDYEVEGIYLMKCRPKMICKEVVDKDFRNVHLK